MGASGAPWFVNPIKGALPLLEGDGRVSSSDDWMSAYNSKASPPQMLLTEQLSPVHSPHLTDFLTTGF